MLRDRYSPFNLTAFNQKLDHGLLLGLDPDDDHPQYWLADTQRSGNFSTTGTIMADGVGSILGGAEHDGTAESAYTRFGDANVFLTRYQNVVAGPDLRFLRARVDGNFAGAFLDNADEIGRIQFRPWNGTGFTETARISALATQPHTDTPSLKLGTKLEFRTTPNDSATQVLRATISSAGLDVVGDSTATGTLKSTNSPGAGLTLIGASTFTITPGATVDFAAGGATPYTFDFNVAITGDISGTGNIIRTGDINLTGDAIISGGLTVDIDTLFVDSVNNWVGIGTTNPGYPLHVYAVGGTNTAMFQNPGGTARIFLWNATRIGGLQQKSSIFSIIDDLADEKLSVNIDTGDVGINTTSPDTKLQVVGDIGIGATASSDIKELRFNEAGNYVGFKAPALSANQIWTLPDADGAANEVLFTNGSGVLGWTDLDVPYGSMYNDNTATTVTIGTSGTFVRIPSGFTQGQVNDVTFGNARELTVSEAGRYKIDWSISFNTVSGTNQDIEGAIGIDNVKNAQGTAHRYITTASDVGNIAGTAILNLTANKVVSLMMTNNTNTVGIVVTHSSLSLVKAENGGGGDGDGILTIEAHTGDDTLTEAESGSVHTNRGAGGVVTLTLPEPSSVGVTYTFAVQAVQHLRIEPGAATIRDDSGQTAGKYKWANAIGEVLKLVADANGDWVTTAKNGLWLEEA